MQVETGPGVPWMSEGERQELKRLLDSRHVKGRRIREALLFLCEKHWEGESVTQYDLSQMLYGNVDNLAGARNLVKSLRQKLELYYATDGRGSTVQLDIPRGAYNIVFREHPEDVGTPGEGPISRPEESEERTGGRAWTPSAGMVATTMVIAILVIVVVTLQGFSRNRRAAAQTLAYEGSEVIGQSGDDPELWRVSFPAHVKKIIDLDPDSANRFAVLYGGLISPESPPAEVTPHLAILSAKGEILRTIDLLAEFNPFHDYYDQRYFRFGLTLTIDFDKDDHQDLLVVCKHIYYPNLLFTISGRKREVTGVFANSGKIKGLVPIDRPGASAVPKVLGIAINNLMGEQLVAFRVPLLIKAVSPDQDSNAVQSLHSYRPTGLIHLAPEPWILEPGNLLKICGVGRSVRFDSQNSILDTDPWYGAERETDQAMNGLVEFYPLVIEARRCVETGEVERGQSLYDRALDMALDEPLRLYALLDAVRALKKAGLARESLERLPENPSDMFHPRRALLLSGELLTILGEYGAAREAYLDVEYVRYSFEGYIQACILGGMNREDLGREVAEHYSLNTQLQTTQAWLKIPALLRGENSAAPFNDEGLLQDPGLVNRTEDIIRYRQESTVWNAAVALERGIVPQSWPDNDYVPMEFGEVYPLKIKALEALRSLVEDGPREALTHLESSYRALGEVARRDSGAIIPFVLLAYTCGFAADEVGHKDLAREALADAVDRYPFGSNYERAMDLLE
jgi:hypothetical protein